MPNEFLGKPAEILLVEDNEADALLTEEALIDSKMHVVLNHVSDGIEALDFLHKRNQYENANVPDLILLDLNMPRMDGRELLQHIKKNPETNTIPVVVLTTSQAQLDIVKSYQLQANCYVTKPVDFEQFQAIVTQIKEFWFTLVKLPKAPD